MKQSKIFKCLVALILTGGILSISNAYAKESGSKSYSFRIQAYHGNAQTSYSIYRDVPTNVYNVPWYLNMTSSEEGTQTVTRYWLELRDGTNVTSDLDAVVGKEYHDAVYGQGNSKDLWLTAENNNYNSTLYTVKGYWNAKSSY